MSKGEWILALCVAAFYDLIGFLGSFIYLNFIVTIFAWMTFALWFYVKGIPFMGRGAISSLVGFMPVIGALPEWIAMVLYSYAKQEVKEKVGIDISNPTKGGIKNMRPDQVPTARTRPQAQVVYGENY